MFLFHGVEVVVFLPSVDNFQVEGVCCEYGDEVVLFCELNVLTHEHTQIYAIKVKLNKCNEWCKVFRRLLIQVIQNDEKNVFVLRS